MKNSARERPVSDQTPLAERLRPVSFEQFGGLGELDRAFVAHITSGAGRLPSAILWGPPGSGKTTLAKLIGKAFDCEFVELSAVLSGVKDVREVVETARERRSTGGKPTLLFVDEIHRFNKGQQDAFLPHVESGVIALIGATTENPSFYLTQAVLSRCRVIVLKALGEDALRSISKRAEESLGITISETARALVMSACTGDGRRLVNLLETLALNRNISGGGAVAAGNTETTEDEVREFLKESGHRVYDRDGEEHYNVASALIKSLRGSDPDAALYWGFRMLDAGEDPRFVIRRLVIFAAEDIGNADPRALQIAVSTLDAYNLIGLPEGRIPLAQCITYLATAPKSNRSYVAMHRAVQAVAKHPGAPVPMHLRNAPTSLMKGLGYGADYQYPHDQTNAYASGVHYLPKEISGMPFYEPSERGNEKTIRERMEWLKKNR